MGYLSTIPPYDVKTQSLNKVIRLGGPNYTYRLSNNYKTVYTFLTSWVVVCTILSVLFWLLLFQNPKEKNLFWIALYTSTLAIYTYYYAIDPSGKSFSEYNTNRIIGWFVQVPSLQLLLPILLIKVFKRKINSRLILILIILNVLNGIGAYSTHSFEMTFRNIFGGSAIFVMGICFYYVITSWKNLRGAQWAIVGGLIFTATIYLVSFIMGLISPNGLGSQYFNLLYRTVEALAFPFSLLIYVSIRFKEMIQEVQANAQTVVELSEEKREQALSQQKVLEEEVTRQTGEIRQTLENLKSTQSQLVQSEKMASLGELTAGIAHEIQNPLNFVNNFSEVNKEMLEELKAERLKSKADRDEATQDELINDVITNEEKISLHGSRASSIVKGMLEHSRNTSGKKELTDINALADEYLRLSYHGLRAKDKSFNASFETYFDKDIPAIEIVPQDMGRVLLNLINNAFYAVKSVEKPLVVIKTEQNQNQIIISVTDNGTGIPEDVKSKIFQPFFTTKPTGQGTGLGLSLAYDIVKAHGGEIKIGNPKPGQVGTTFIITLPLSNQTS